MTLLAGIFVGGRSTRMGGLAKGLLASPEGPSIVERWERILRGLGHDVVLVGARTEQDAYAHLPLERIADEPPGIGPLGGLVALLRRAAGSRALAVACDMPFVSRDLVERLGNFPAGGPILAPRRDGRWEPLFARYDAASVLPLALAQAANANDAAGSRSLQRLLDRSGAVELPLSPGEERELDDWDSPKDTEDTRTE